MNRPAAGVGDCEVTVHVLPDGDLEDSTVARRMDGLLGGGSNA